MCEDGPNIVTVGKPKPLPDLAGWLREQPHHRKIVLCCRDEPSITGEFPVYPVPFRCIHASVSSLVDGRMAGAQVLVSDQQASDPVRLIQLILEEASAAFADLGESESGQISER